MDDLLRRHSALIHQLRKIHSTVTPKSVTELFDDIVTFLNETDHELHGLHILTIISHDLASINTLKLFDNADIIDHELFVYMKYTFEMLLTKSNNVCLPHIKMTVDEEQCFYELSYLIAHLCLYRNETLMNFFTRSTTKHPREFTTKEDHNIADKIPQVNHSPQVQLRKTKLVADRLITVDETLGKSTEISTMMINDPQKVIAPSKTCGHQSYQDIFLTKTILTKLAVSISDLAQNDYTPYHVKYKVTDRLLRLCSKLTDINVDLLIDPVVECLSSKFYLLVFDTIDLRQPIFNPKQSFFICECLHFLDEYGFKQHDKIATGLCKLMLENTTIIFKKHLPVIVESDIVSKLPEQFMYETDNEKGARMQAIGYHIKLLNYLALRPSTRGEFFSGTIIDDILSILKTQALVESVKKNQQLFHVDVGVIAWSLTLLYNLMFDKNLFKTLKEKRTMNICEQFHKAIDDTIHFTSQTISTLLAQEKIDDIEEPYRLTKSYLYYIGNTVHQRNQTYHGIKLNNVLQNLEIISRNEDVQESIVKDEQGIVLLAECVCNPVLDDKTIQEPAMRIIFTVSFAGENATEKIKEIDQLMEYIKEATKSTEITKERPAKGIMWNVENEQIFINNKVKQEKEHESKRQLEITATTPQPSQTSEINKIVKPKETSYEYVRGDFKGWDALLDGGSKPIPIPEEPEVYEMMISYCHAQRDICHRIYDCFVRDKFEVWIDKENMYGSVLEAMAEAVERSEIIIMCMSSKYKDSDACRLEASYAWKRKKKIIPIKVEAKYDPTGWLGILCSDKSYIDFTKHDFDKAYQDLLKEMKMVKTSDRK